MLKIPFLRNILLVSLLFATAFPLYDLLYIIPSYQKLLIQEAEREAARFVRFLIVSHDLDQLELSSDSIPQMLVKDVAQLKAENQLEKLRIFSPAGEIVFSSDSMEIGTFNNKSYFHQLVAKGKTYSKMVHNQSVTAEGSITDRDLVETYIPVMVDGRFNGAMEVYYDISIGQQSLLSLSRQSFFILIGASIGLLLMTLMLLFRAHNSIVARDQAEVALQQINEDLEERVLQRTAELSRTDQLLSSEIVERKKAQQAQRESFAALSEAHSRIDSIISSVADALLVTDHEDVVVLINPVAEALFKVRADDVVGCRLPDVIGFDQLLLEIAKARQELRNSPMVEFDFEMIQDGEIHIFQGRTARLKDAQNTGSSLVLLIHDVTRERQIEKMKSEFVSMAAHELQTPLTMILGYSELLLDQSKHFADEARDEFLQIINDKSIELSGLIDDILDLSRIEDGRGIQLNFSKVEIAGLCQRLIENFARTNSSHQFKFEQSEDDLVIEADEPRLVQVLENLLGNAVKYSPDGGGIQVVLQREGESIRLEITDQGIGMSDEVRENALERFYRGDASNTAVRGTGLGLSIAKYIIDAHGGQIEIFSTKGTGTQLVIRLPLAV